MTTQTLLNGIDTGVINSTVEAIGENAGLAKFKFRLSNKWVNGGHNHSVVGDFYGAEQENLHLETFELDADEPEIMAGEDQAANPVEYLLHALAGCLTSSLVYHAALENIRIEELEAELEGDIDLRGFLAISNDVRKGYQAIRVNFRVKTDAENLERLKALTKFSPVFDVVSNGTKVDIQIEKK